MDYNTNKEKIKIPEYGRHIQNMVEYCKNIKDRDKRNEFANVIIEVMGSVSPHLRDVIEFQHKLWDQLFIISDFSIDIDSPYTPPTKNNTIYSKPNKVNYPINIKNHRYYGNNIKKMIEVAVTWEKGDKREGLNYAIANHMKKCYIIWNKETVDDKIILDHLYELSNKKIDLRNSKDKLIHFDKNNIFNRNNKNKVQRTK